MRRILFIICISILTVIFYLWSPFDRGAEEAVYAEKEGRLLLPEYNVAIVTVDLNEAGISFTQADELLRLRPLQQAFVEMSGATKVDSILSVSRVISRFDDIIVARAIPASDAQVTDEYLSRLSMEIADFPELSPYVDEEMDTLLFYIYFTKKTTSLEILEGLKDLQTEWRDSVPFEFTGRSPVIAETEQLLTKDISIFFPVLVIMVLLVFSLFRSAKAVVASLALIVIAIVSAFGLVRFLGISNSPLLLLIPVFSLGLLSDYLIHYFYHRIYSSLSEREGGLRKVLMFPLSLTALSTLIGFLSLSLINGSGHLQLGIIIAAAVVVTWFGVFYWLDHGRYKSSEKKLLANFQSLQGKLFGRIVNYRYIFFLVIAAAMVWGTLQLRDLSIEPYPIEQLPESSSIKQADRVINSEFYGTVPFFIEVDTGEKNGILKKDTMLEMDRIHRRLEEDEVGFSYSLLTVLKRMNYYFMGDEDSLLTSTEFDDFYDALIEQYLLYYSSGVDPLEYESLLDNSYRVFSLRGLIYYRNYDDLNAFIRLIEDLEAEFPDNWSLSIHGMAKQLEKEQLNLRNNWVISFLGGSLLIFITVWIFYKKLSLALLSLIPGIVSMLISFGFISLANIRIDVFSIIFVAIITGLVIDYSIHTLVALDRLGRVESLEKGFSAVVGYSGIPIFLSFLTSLLSFSVLFLSSFRGARNLGFLLLISLICSFFLSLYLIPLIILPIRLSKERKNA